MYCDVNAKLKKTKNYFELDDGSECVILASRKGVFLGLQDTSYEIWRLIDHFDTVQLIKKEMYSTYCNCDYSVLNDDVYKILDKLFYNELIEVL